MGRTYDLGVMPRPVVVQLIRADGTKSALYALASRLVEVPEGVAAVVIRQLPVFPGDYPAGDEPGWGNRSDGEPSRLPGEGAEARVEVRGRERFQGGS
jgi:hypothetical protein